ncbi:hypothetical protein pb186bvf_016372 [Paramecium bursaria]
MHYVRNICLSDITGTLSFLLSNFRSKLSTWTFIIKLSSMIHMTIQDSYQMNVKNIISYYAKETFQQIQIIDNKINQLVNMERYLTYGRQIINKDNYLSQKNTKIKKKFVYFFVFLKIILYELIFIILILY